MFYSTLPTSAPFNPAPKYDAYDDVRHRGLTTAGYVFTLTTPTIQVYDNSLGEMIVFGKSGEGSFGNADMSTIAGKLVAGCYGQIMCFKMQIMNGTSVSRKMRVALASRGGPSHFLIGLTTDTSFTNPHSVYTRPMYSNPHTFHDVVETDSISPGSFQTVNFFTVVPSGSSAPYALSARTV